MTKGGLGLIQYVFKSIVNPPSDAYNLGFAKTSKRSGKEKASDAPDWVKTLEKKPGESSTDFATRVLNYKYGTGNWKKGANSEYSQIKKWYERK